MRKILYVICILLIFITGCSGEKTSVEDKATEPPQQSSEQNTIYTSEDDSKTVIEHILDKELKLSNDDSNEITIKDKMFIAQCNDIYLNTDEYLDKTIIWEGIYTESTNPETGNTYKFVIRYGPGCCGNDGVAGFEVLYDQETPKADDWVKAVGKIEMVEQGGIEFVAIRLSELTVLDVRGQEFVSN